MQNNEYQPSRARKTVNDLVLAEMFLLQATIESASAIGDGLGEISRKISSEDEGSHSWSAITSVLQRTADDALEPYTSRYKYFKEMRDAEK